MSAATTAPIFLSLPQELRLTIYSLLPVARIHRKNAGLPTLVVHWFPTSVLKTCRRVREEASAITTATVRRYRRARRESGFRAASWYDTMPRVVTAWTNSGPEYGDAICRLIRAALAYKSLLADARELVDVDAAAAAVGHFDSAALEGCAAARDACEWAVQAGMQLANSSLPGMIDIAVVVGGVVEWDDIVGSQRLFDRVAVHRDETARGGGGGGGGAGLMSVREVDVCFTVTALWHGCAAALSMVQLGVGVRSVFSPEMVGLGSEVEWREVWRETEWW